MKNVVTLNEAAAYLRLTRSKMYQMKQSGSIPFEKKGKSIFFRREDLDKYKSGANEFFVFNENQLIAGG
jgi:excisionase family DNA binding protein